MISERVDAVLKEKGLYDEDAEVQEKYLKSLDSLQFIELIVALEVEFEIGIDDKYLSIENFTHKDKIVKVISEMLSVKEKNIRGVISSGECFGCNVCVEMCPNDNIMMGDLEEGPKIGDNCIECGICISICPAILEKEGDVNEKEEKTNR